MNKKAEVEKYIREQYIDYGDLNEQAEKQIAQAFLKGIEAAINYTQCCMELCECADPFEKTIALKCTGCGMLTEDD